MVNGPSISTGTRVWGSGRFPYATDVVPSSLAPGLPSGLCGPCGSKGLVVANEIADADRRRCIHHFFNVGRNRVCLRFLCPVLVLAALVAHIDIVGRGRYLGENPATHSGPLGRATTVATGLRLGLSLDDADAGRALLT